MLYPAFKLSVIARRQACYDGAVGVRAMHKLQSFGDQPKYSNNAYTITSTLSSGLLTIYTVHLIQATDPADPPEYYMTQLDAWALTGNLEKFRHGAGALRNARDWAKEQRDAFIAAANDRVSAMPIESIVGSSSIYMTQSTVGPMVLDSNTSTDELVQGLIDLRAQPKNVWGENQRNHPRTLVEIYALRIVMREVKAGLGVEVGARGYDSVRWWLCSCVYCELAGRFWQETRSVSGECKTKGSAPVFTLYNYLNISISITSFH